MRTTYRVDGLPAPEQPQGREIVGDNNLTPDGNMHPPGWTAMGRPVTTQNAPAASAFPISPSARGSSGLSIRDLIEPNQAPQTPAVDSRLGTSRSDLTRPPPAAPR